MEIEAARRDGGRRSQQQILQPRSERRSDVAVSRSELAVQSSSLQEMGEQIKALSKEVSELREFLRERASGQREQKAADFILMHAKKLGMICIGSVSTIVGLSLLFHVSPVAEALGLIAGAVGVFAGSFATYKNKKNRDTIHTYPEWQRYPFCAMIAFRLMPKPHVRSRNYFLLTRCFLFAVYTVTAYQPADLPASERF